MRKAQKNLIGKNYSYRNYMAIYDRSYMSATKRNSDYNIEKQLKKIIHDKDDAAVVIMKIHTLMNWT